MAYQIRQFLNHRCLMVFNPALSGERMPLIRNHTPAPDSGTGIELWEKACVYGSAYSLTTFDDLTGLQANVPVSPMIGGE